MIQRRGARFLCRGYRSEVDVISSILSKLNWSTLQERRIATRLALLYEIVNTHIAIDTGHRLQTSVQNTKSNNYIAPDFINICTSKDFYKYSFFPSTMSGYATKKIPDIIIDSTNQQAPPS